MLHAERDHLGWVGSAGPIDHARDGQAVRPAVVTLGPGRRADLPTVRPEVAAFARRHGRAQGEATLMSCGDVEVDGRDRPGRWIETPVVVVGGPARSGCRSPGATALSGHEPSAAVGPALGWLDAGVGGRHRRRRQRRHVPVLCADGAVQPSPGRLRPRSRPHGELSALMTSRRRRRSGRCPDRSRLTSKAPGSRSGCLRHRLVGSRLP